MKVNRAALLSFFLCSTGTKTLVYGAPMNPEHGQPEIPVFENPLEQDLDAPIYSPPLYHDYQGWQYEDPFYPNQDQQHHRSLSDNYPMNADSHHFYGNVPSQQSHRFQSEPHHIDGTDVSSQQGYGVDHLSTSFTQGMQLENQFIFDRHDSIYHPEMDHGQSSISFPPHPTSPYLPPNPSYPPPAPRLTYFNRPYISKEEENGRHERLNLREWQKKYHQNELLTIYGLIANKWGTLPRSTLTGILYLRLLDQLQKHPGEIDMILAGNETVVKFRAKKSGKKHDKKDRPNSSSTRVMTPEEFLRWIISSNYAKFSS